MRGKIIGLFLLLALTSACTTPANHSDIASLYTGYESGSWYKVSSTCSAKLCPAY